MAYRKKTQSRAVAVAAPVAFDVSPRRAAAVLVQLGSWAATWSLVVALAGPNADPRLTAVIAAAVEYVLILGKAELLKGRPDLLSLVCLLLDALTNTGGIFPLVMRLDQAGSYQALSAGLSLENKVNGIAGCIVAISLGVVLSLAPHKLWRDQ